MQVNNNTPMNPLGNSIPVDQASGEQVVGQFNATQDDKNQVGQYDKKDNSQNIKDQGMPEPKDTSNNKTAVNNAYVSINWDQADFTPMALMEALFEANKKMRAAGMEARNNELNMQVNSLLGQAKDIKDAADKTKTANLIQGWVSIGSGVVSGLSSGVGLGKSYGASKDLKDLKTTTELRKEFKLQAKNQSHDATTRAEFKTEASSMKSDIGVYGRKIDQSSAVTQATNAAGTAIATTAGGAATASAAGKTQEASELEAEGKKKEAEATRMSAELQKTNELTQNAKEQLKAVFDLILATLNAKKSVSDTINKNMV